MYMKLLKLRESLLLFLPPLKRFSCAKRSRYRPGWIRARSRSLVVLHAGRDREFDRAIGLVPLPRRAARFRMRADARLSAAESFRRRNLHRRIRQRIDRWEY